MTLIFWAVNLISLLVLGVFGHGSGSFGDGMLSQFSRKDKFDSCLDICTSQRLVVSVPWHFSSDLWNLMVNIEDNRVHGGHGIFTDANLSILLSQKSEDVGLEFLLWLEQSVLRSLFLGFALSSRSSSSSWCNFARWWGNFGFWWLSSFVGWHIWKFSEW